MTNTGLIDGKWIGTEYILTAMERACIEFLSGKMDATAEMVGRVLYKQFYEAALPNYAHIGSGVLSSLRRKGLVMRLPELRAWRLTKEGMQYGIQN